MDEYKETREQVRESLRKGGEYALEIIQKRPYTVAMIKERPDGQLLGIGFAKVNYKDPWAPDYGKRLAVEKAIADAAKEIIGECSLLEINGERVAVHVKDYCYEAVPGWLLDDDLSESPKTWNEEIPF